LQSAMAGVNPFLLIVTLTLQVFGPADAVRTFPSVIARLPQGPQARGLSDFVPKLKYDCKVDTEDGRLDRWISVTPHISAAERAWSWVSFTEWQKWIEAQVGLTEAEEPSFDFDPFILRNRTEFGSRTLLKTVMAPTSGDPCTTTYSASCSTDEELEIIKEELCHSSDIGKPTVTVLPLGSFSKSMSVCGHEIKYDYGYWGTGRTLDVFVIDENGKGQKMERGQCVEISTINPSNGIHLSELDYDLMGLGSTDFGANASKVEKVVRMLNGTLHGIAQGLLKKGEEILEGGHDALEVANKLDEDLVNGSQVAVNTSVKWIKRLTLATMVETCLCCDTEVIDTNESLPEHCRVAYTLGGQDKSQTLKYTLKTTAGTLYNLAQTAGGWLVPFLGGNIVRETHTRTCHFTCGMRKAYLYEPYRFGKVRKVPGLALQTWFIPNPASFFGTASGAAGEIAEEVIVEGAAQGAANSVVTDIVSTAA